MNQQQQFHPSSELGFEIDPPQSNNYPDGFVMPDQLERERKMNLEIINDNGGMV